MTERDAESRDQVRARLAASREEYRAILDPPRPDNLHAGETSAGLAHFPRSRTMRMLLGRRGLGTLGAIAAAILVARPKLALKVWRMLPTKMLRRLLIGRAIAMLTR
jgi:hypothetical protein